MRILNNVELFLEHIMTGFEKSSHLTQAQLSKLCSEMHVVKKFKADAFGQNNLPQETVRPTICNSIINVCEL